MAKLTEQQKIQKLREKEIAKRDARDAKICKAYDSGKHSIRGLAPKFGMSASGIYHVLKRNDRIGVAMHKTVKSSKTSKKS